MTGMRSGITAACLTLGLLTGCSGEEPDVDSEQSSETAPDTAAEDAAPSAPEVRWSDYPPELQRIIEEEAADGDCKALQEMFDVWDNAGAADVMEFIDFQLSEAGCYE